MYLELATWLGVPLSPWAESGATASALHDKTQSTQLRLNKLCPFVSHGTHHHRNLPTIAVTDIATCTSDSDQTSQACKIRLRQIVEAPRRGKHLSSPGLLRCPGNKQHASLQVSGIAAYATSLDL